MKIHKLIIGAAIVMSMANGFAQKYQKQLEFSEGLAAVQNKNGQWGFIDEKGKEVIKCKYFEVGYFSEGLVRAREIVKGKAGEFGFINKNGKVIIPFQYRRVGNFSEGLCAVSYSFGSTIAFLDVKGTRIIPPYYYCTVSDILPDFHNGSVLVQENTKDCNGKVMFIDKKLNEVKKYDYMRANIGIVVVGNNKKYGVIDGTGKEIIPLKYDYIGDFKVIKGLYESTFAIVELNNKYGFIDDKGNEIIPAQYEEVNEFHKLNDLILTKVKLNNKYGYIDTNNKIIIPLKYDEIGHFNNGILAKYAVVKTNNRYGIIDMNDKEVIPCKYEMLGNMNTCCAAKYNGEWGVINTEGKVIIPFIYENATKIRYASVYNATVCMLENGKWYEINLATGEKKFMTFKPTDSDILDQDQLLKDPVSIARRDSMLFQVLTENIENNDTDAIVKLVRLEKKIQAKIDEEKRIAQAKIEEEKRLAAQQQAKIEEEKKLAAERQKEQVKEVSKARERQTQANVAGVFARFPIAWASIYEDEVVDNYYSYYADKFTQKDYPPIPYGKMVVRCCEYSDCYIATEYKYPNKHSAYGTTNKHGYDSISGVYTSWIRYYYEHASSFSKTHYKKYAMAIVQEGGKWGCEVFYMGSYTFHVENTIPVIYSEIKHVYETFVAVKNSETGKYALGNAEVIQSYRNAGIKTDFEYDNITTSKKYEKWFDFFRVFECEKTVYEVKNGQKVKTTKKVLLDDNGVEWTNAELAGKEEYALYYKKKAEEAIEARKAREARISGGIDPDKVTIPEISKIGDWKSNGMVCFNAEYKKEIEWKDGTRGYINKCGCSNYSYRTSNGKEYNSEANAIKAEYVDKKYNKIIETGLGKTDNKVYCP